MKIFALCVVKNEADIVEECLRSASLWADRIFVYDGASTDGTWEKVCAMQNDVIVAWKQDGKPFQESLREEIFREFRHEAQEGDWWCHLDADEFYDPSPREFLSLLPRWRHVVWSIGVEYYITREDLQQIDFTRPTAQLLPLLRHYRAEHSEPRFFRHRDRLVWREHDGWPTHLGIPEPERLLMKHYKYRSPQQIQLRIDTRLKSQQGGFVVRDQYRSTNWEQEISDGSNLDMDAQNGQYRLRYDKLPYHLDTWSRFLLKRFMHGTGLWP